MPGTNWNVMTASLDLLQAAAATSAGNSPWGSGVGTAG